MHFRTFITVMAFLAASYTGAAAESLHLTPPHDLETWVHATPQTCTPEKDVTLSYQLHQNPDQAGTRVSHYSTIARNGEIIVEMQVRLVNGNSAGIDTLVKERGAWTLFRADVGEGFASEILKVNTAIPPALGVSGKQLNACFL